MRTGYYGYPVGFAAGITYYGFWWSNTAVSNTQGHELATSQTYVKSAHNDDRGHGFAIRCTIRVE